MSAADKGRQMQDHKSLPGGYLERLVPYAAAGRGDTFVSARSLAAGRLDLRSRRAGGAAPDGEEQERAQGLQHYFGKRSYRLEYRGFPASVGSDDGSGGEFRCASHQTFHHRQCDRVEDDPESRLHRLLESEQQAGDSGNRKQTELGPDNYIFSLAAADGADYVLNVEPKVESRFLYRGKIWVDAHDFAVTRIEAQPARNPSFWTTKSLIHHTYQKTDNGFYLPKENKTVTNVRMGGVATLTIEYESYKVTAAPSATSAGKAITSGEQGVWPDSPLQAVASFAPAQK